MSDSGGIVPSGDVSARMTDCSALPKTFHVLAQKTLGLGNPLSPLGKPGWLDTPVSPCLSPRHHFHEASLLHLKGSASIGSGNTDENVNMLIVQSRVTGFG